jgi:hypothetical protein
MYEKGCKLIDIAEAMGYPRGKRPNARPPCAGSGWRVEGRTLDTFTLALGLQYQLDCKVGKHMKPTPHSEIRQIMQARYPLADFGPYFAFLKTIGSASTIGGHRHHIAPRKQFPEYKKCAANYAVLSVEQHTAAHRLLAQASPEFRHQPTPQFIAAACRGGSIGGRTGGQRKARGAVIMAASSTGFYIKGAASRGREKQISQKIGMFAEGQQAKAGKVRGRKSIAAFARWEKYRIEKAKEKQL